jgi:hypothetical protein
VRPCCTLHLEVLRQVAVIVGALDLVGVPHVAVIGFDMLAWLKTVDWNAVKNNNVGIPTCGVGTLDPNLNPRENVDSKLVLVRRFARILVQGKVVALLCRTLLLDAEVGAINSHEAIIAYVVDETALKDNLWFGEQQCMMRQGEMMMDEDMTR